MRLVLTSCLSVAIASLSFHNVNAEELPILSRLVIREGTVLVSKDRQGELRYSLIDRNGDQTETNISQEQLATKYPDIYERFNPAVAEDGQIPYSGMQIHDR